MIETPRGNRVHIAIYGRTNAGKSSLINKITNQSISLVSETGTVGLTQYIKLWNFTNRSSSL